MARSNGLKLKCLNLFTLTFQVVWVSCGLVWCFYQLFGLSFWRHPFTADDPLLSKSYNAKFLQICSDKETSSSPSQIGWEWEHFQNLIFWGGWIIPLILLTFFSVSDYFDLRGHIEGRIRVLRKLLKIDCKQKYILIYTFHSYINQCNFSCSSYLSPCQ